MKTLKERVLEKSKELMPELGTMFINGDWDIGRSSKDKYELHRAVNGSRISYQFDPKVSETDPVWPLAASVLGVGVEKIPYPDTLSEMPLIPSLRTLLGENIRLLKASKDTKPDWVKEELAKSNPNYNLFAYGISFGMQHCGVKDTKFIDLAAFGSNARAAYEKFLQTLPPDTLKEDRELVKRNLSQVISGEYDWVKIRQHDDLFKAIQRLCGMEVGE